MKGCVSASRICELTNSSDASDDELKHKAAVSDDDEEEETPAQKRYRIAKQLLADMESAGYHPILFAGLNERTCS